MIAIFDLDHTLLNTSEFKDALTHAISAYGPSVEDIEDAYEISMNRKEDGTGTYDPEDQMRILVPRFADSLCVKEAEQAFRDVVRRAGEYLYPGASTMLLNLRKEGVTLILMTFGNEVWQKRKVTQSGIDDFFDEVITTSESKTDLLSRYTGQDVVVINDNVPETIAMRDKEPAFRYIIKPGPKGTDGHDDIPVIESFEKIEAKILAR